MKKIVVIVGPTASGKTKLAINLAKKIPFSLINGDSVQIYKGLDIGSDKIGEDIRKDYPHYLLDEITLDNDYTVFDYQRDVRKYLDQFDYPLLVGGSGFYIKAAINDYHFVNETQDNKKVDKLLKKGLLKCKKYLLKKDPAINIDFTNERKVRRAIIQVMNNTLPSKNHDEDIPLYDSLIIYLDMPRDILREKVVLRINNQLANGFEEEVRSLIKYENKIKDILGYREMLEYIKSNINLEQYKELVTNKTMQLAKRQKTWFKNKMNVISFDALDNNLEDKVLIKIKEFLNA